jgi:ABC-type glycerol-3-phosphate transport system substrate-binding protein
MAAAIPGAGCALGGGAPSASAPAARLRKGATIVWAVDDGPTRTPLREAQTALFKQQFPDLDVEYVLGATSEEKIQALFAAGTPPDLFRQEAPSMAQLGTQGQLVVLDPLLRRDKVDLSDFFPRIWDHWSWRGKRYGVPFLGVQVAYYNRALAQQVGARVPATWKDGSWTWEAFLDANRRATVAQGATATRWGNAIGTDRFSWQPWVWSNGGDVFNDDATKVLLGDAPAVEALQFRADLIHKYHVAPTGQELAALGGLRPLFLGGNVLLYYNPINNVAANRREATFDWSLAPLPRGKGQPATYGGGVGWFLAAESRARDETWELAKVLASKDSVRLEAVRGEAPPSRRSVAAEPEFARPAEPPGADMQVVVEALDLIHFDAVLLQGVRVATILDEQLAPMWRGEKTAREAVGSAVDLIKPLLNPPA